MLQQVQFLDHLTRSGGGHAAAQQFTAKDSLLSGPAGGVVGAAHIATQLGVTKILTLDMGGTSTDTAHYNGQLDYRFQVQVGDATVLSPGLAIETVAAGGGSICMAKDGKLLVGPESAGADPGPACYGAGGPLTITDVNLLLGKFEMRSKTGRTQCTTPLYSVLLCNAKSIFERRLRID